MGTRVLSWERRG